MKLSSAAVALALSGSAVAAGGADTVNQILLQIADDLKKFDGAIQSWKSGDISSLESASKQIQSDTEAGTAKIGSIDTLTLVDAAGITPNAQGLQNQLDQTLNDLKKISDNLAAGGHCASIQASLKSQSAAASGLQEAITSKTPTEAKSIAAQLGGGIGASLKDTQATIDKACASAPSSAPAGGSGSGASGGASGGAKPATAAGSGSGSSSGGASSSSGAHSGGHGSASSPKAATTTAPVGKPATYTGAGSTVKVPFAVALALAVFAL